MAVIRSEENHRKCPEQHYMQTVVLIATPAGLSSASTGLGSNSEHAGSKKHIPSVDCSGLHGGAEMHRGGHFRSTCRACGNSFLAPPVPVSHCCCYKWPPTVGLHTWFATFRASCHGIWPTRLIQKKKKTFAVNSTDWQVSFYLQLQFPLPCNSTVLGSKE